MQHITPPRMPTVMTRAMVTKAPTDSSSNRRPDRPMDWAAISATLSSYCKAPMTDRRSQEKGTPSEPLRAMTPSRILMEGSSVKVALAVMVRRSTFLSIPSLIPAR